MHKHVSRLQVLVGDPISAVGGLPKLAAVVRETGFLSADY